MNLTDTKTRLQLSLQGAETAKRTKIEDLLKQLKLTTTFLERLSELIQLRRAVANGIREALEGDAQMSARERQQLIGEKKKCEEHTETLQNQWQEALEERQKKVQNMCRRRPNLNNWRSSMARKSTSDK